MELSGSMTVDGRPLSPSHRVDGERQEVAEAVACVVEEVWAWEIERRWLECGSFRHPVSGGVLGALAMAGGVCVQKRKRRLGSWVYGWGRRARGRRRAGGDVAIDWPGAEDSRTPTITWCSNSGHGWPLHELPVVALTETAEC